MLRRQIEILCKTGYPAIVRVPEYRRKQMAKKNIIVSEYVSAQVFSVRRSFHGGQCNVLVLNEEGIKIKVLAGSVIKLRGRGDNLRELTKKTVGHVRDKNKSNKHKQMEIEQCVLKRLAK